MSPMRVATLVASSVLTTTALGLLTINHATGRQLVPDDVTATLVVATAVTWLAFAAAHCRDSVSARMDHLERRINELPGALEDFGDRQAAAGAVAALRDVAGRPAPRPRANGTDDASGRLKAVD